MMQEVEKNGNHDVKENDLRESFMIETKEEKGKKINN